MQFLIPTSIKLQLYKHSHIHYILCHFSEWTFPQISHADVKLSILYYFNKTIFIKQIFIKNNFHLNEKYIYAENRTRNVSIKLIELL